ncbi:MAG: glycosyltransferase family 9 protein [Planctomycetota bacterium]
MPDPSRVLIIRPSALGDVCRSVPAAVFVHRHWPKARIDWLVFDAFSPVVEHHPCVQGVVRFHRRLLGEAISRGRIGPVTGFLRSLREAKYDVVFDLQGLARSGLFTWATRAPRRVGLADARELGWLGYTERYRIAHDIHSVDRMMGVLNAAGVPTHPPTAAELRLYTGEVDRQWLAGEQRLAGRRYAVVAPTSRWVGKRWPASRFAELVPRLLSMGLDAVALVGSSGERAQCGPVLELAASSPSRVIDLIGGTTVGQVMALIEGAALVVANDSAALHIAVGFARPFVALYGPTRVELVGPYGGREGVLQHVGPDEPLNHKDAEAGQRIMERITVDQAADLAHRVLGAPPV